MPYPVRRSFRLLALLDRRCVNTWSVPIRFVCNLTSVSDSVCDRLAHFSISDRQCLWCRPSCYTDEIIYSSYRWNVPTAPISESLIRWRPLWGDCHCLQMYSIFIQISRPAGMRTTMIIEFLGQPVNYVAFLKERKGDRKLKMGWFRKVRSTSTLLKKRRTYKVKFLCCVERWAVSRKYRSVRENVFNNCKNVKVQVLGFKTLKTQKA